MYFFLTVHAAGAVEKGRLKTLKGPLRRNTGCWKEHQAQKHDIIRERSDSKV